MYNACVVNPTTLNVTLTFDLEPKEFVYHDSLLFSVDNPDIALSAYKTTNQPIEKYDEKSKKTKKVFEGSFTLEITASSAKALSHDSNLHAMYFLNTDGKLTHQVYPLPWPSTGGTNDVPERSAQSAPLQAESCTTISSDSNDQSWSIWSASTYVSSMVQRTNSMTVRLIFVFFLGLLLSLTPCIYPMIPITVGILQAQRSSSVIYNFLLSTSYTFGLATTFACFGLIASSMGPLYGTLLVNPLSVLIIVAILLYLAFSMFGWYEIYIPRSLQSSQTTGNGSLTSAFLFGAASGTIASPCVSPGLALLLSIVATMGNAFMGFLLLFVFGVGLSTPLLIVGTASNSLSMMPKAGMWMVEIKKFFGIMLLGVCFYYISNIVSGPALLLLIALSIGMFGVYYIIKGHSLPSKHKKANHTSLGTIFIIIALVLCAQAAKDYVTQSDDSMADSLWYSNATYQDAVDSALKEHKNLFIDCWAQYCSICKAINKTVLSDPALEQVLETYVCIKIDGTNESNEPFKTLKDRYEIMGFPTLLVVDPTTSTVLKRWSSEVYSMPRSVFAQELKKYAYNQ
jgi:thiol:disulfide interchange protein DsbD